MGTAEEDPPVPGHGDVSAHFEDSSGDSFEFLEAKKPYYLYDIRFIDVTIDREDLYATMSLTFENQVYPPVLEWGDNGLVGFLEIDADQNSDTGTTLATIEYDQYIGIDFWADIKGYPLSNMGVDYSINLFEYDDLFHTVTIHEHRKDAMNPDNIIIEQTGYAGMEYGERSCTLRIPLAALGNEEGNMDFGFILGSSPGPTDMAYTYTMTVD